jgi:hypothetical protein
VSDLQEALVYLVDDIWRRFSMLQAPLLDGLAFDPLSFQQDGLALPK